MAREHRVHIRGVNKGIVVGGSVRDSTLTVRSSGDDTPETDAPLDQALSRLDELVALLLEKLPGELAPAHAAAVEEDARQLKTELAAPEPDRGRFRSLLAKLGAVATVATPLAEIVKDITDLVTGLLH